MDGIAMTLYLSLRRIVRVARQTERWYRWLSLTFGLPLSGQSLRYVRCVISLLNLRALHETRLG